MSALGDGDGAQTGGGGTCFHLSPLQILEISDRWTPKCAPNAANEQPRARAPRIIAICSSLSFCWNLPITSRSDFAGFMLSSFFVKAKGRAVSSFADPHRPPVSSFVTLRCQVSPLGAVSKDELLVKHVPLALLVAEWAEPPSLAMLERGTSQPL